MNPNIQIISEELAYFKSVALRSLPNQFKHLAEDLAQDAIALAIQKIEKYNPEKGNFKSWLYRLTQNVCFDAIRKLKKLDTTPLSLHAFHLEKEEDLYMEEYRNKMRKVRQSLNHLNDRDRKIITAKFLMDLSGKELSELLGIPENQINVYVKRAKEKLRMICLAA